jgi:protocatechuate 3,4-dioxygenase beta subunit
VVRPELTIGPYFVDDQLNRSDIRSDPFEGFVKEGVPLGLNIGVFSVGNKSCSPLTGAQVDVWHCDAFGVYSDVLQPGFDTRPQKFLRGYQITDTKGSVHFQTIYPGWYSGRTVHIHFMIRTKGTGGRAYEYTSQLFFLDALTDIVHAREPYVRKGPRNTRNLQDNVFKQGGIQLLLNVVGDKARGYIAGINIGLDLSNAEVGKPDRSFN